MIWSPESKNVEGRPRTVVLEFTRTLGESNLKTLVMKTRTASY